MGTVARSTPAHLVRQMLAISGDDGTRWRARARRRGSVPVKIRERDHARTFSSDRWSTVCVRSEGLANVGGAGRGPSSGALHGRKGLYAAKFGCDYGRRAHWVYVRVAKGIG